MATTMKTDNFDMISKLVKSSRQVLIVQAENPDADSLSSALALEAILNEQSKDASLFCAVDIPDYLKYLEGWSRVNKNLPDKFDLSIIVDASTKVLFEKSINNGVFKSIESRPCVVLDHHIETANNLDFASLIINEPGLSSTCELIYRIAKGVKWRTPLDALTYIANGILGDTQGLSNHLAAADTYRLMAELVDSGVDRPLLEETRRAQSKMQESIYRFKAKLIMKTEFTANGRIAYVVINQQEINEYSPLYNPGPLIQPDMLQVEGVMLGIVFKVYDNGSVTAMIRANNGAEIADRLASHFGGGGHAYASGFKISDGKPFSKILPECLETATKFLDAI